MHFLWIFACVSLSLPGVRHQNLTRCAPWPEANLCHSAGESWCQQMRMRLSTQLAQYTARCKD